MLASGGVFVVEWGCGVGRMRGGGGWGGGGTKKAIFGLKQYSNPPQPIDINLICIDMNVCFRLYDIYKIGQHAHARTVYVYVHVHVRV